MRRGAEVQEIKKFAKNIRLVRHRLGVSQMALADKVGCHINYYGRLERGQLDPSLSMMVRVARALGIVLSDLLS